MDRRTFLGSTIALLSTTRAYSAVRPPVVDAHLHCFAGRDDPHFPYHPQAPYRPEEPATPGHLLRLMEEAGVDRAVVVHPEPYQDDHRYLAHCLEAGGGRLKGTCLFFADRPGATDRMAALVKAHEGRIVGARIHAYAPDRLPPFGTPELRSYWAKAGELGLAIQLHFEPRYAPGFEPLIREFPGTTVLIDHLGRPFQGTPEEYAVVLGWAKFPHTIMKLSSLPAAGQYPHREVGPVLDDLVARFGPRRLMYGGGYGAEATGGSYRAARERLRSYLGRLSAEDQAEVLGGTAARLFGFPAA